MFQNMFNMSAVSILQDEYNLNMTQKKLGTKNDDIASLLQIKGKYGNFFIMVKEEQETNKTDIH